MRRFYLFASTYESAELMKRHHQSDCALELTPDRISDLFETIDDTQEKVVEQFLDSIQFETFMTRCTGKTVCIYYLNELGEPVGID